MTAAGVVKMSRRRGSFSGIAAKEWMEAALQSWIERGNALQDVVVVCDNAPCHNGLNSLFEDSAAELLRLGPYSPMLNPCETLW